MLHFKILAARPMEIPSLEQGSEKCLTFSRVTCTMPLRLQAGVVVTFL